ncbi:ABC-type multidrug transport system fused ATPase/permease subunit [Planomicrobium stackebrandtii]|uniref:ABC-type multidrug transport system fused ATPase/permease subunit n=1 Tax=Planomicrobium stackebrandtii TaxID=253160 RepID=A0ABU0GXY5_9BACL|nr:ABC transporter ATP-binding protein [Planomicrobium stackebrandtii]MDQ0430219.1 ABC-type multidrug transport system fused ATPase/permease subunit [Planomicrobium stackebrandtii]
MFDVLWKLKWFFKENWLRYTTAIVLLFFANILEIIPPWLIGIAIDSIAQGELTAELMWQYIAVLAAALVLAYLINFVWQYQLFGGAYVIERQLRSSLMGHFLKMTPTFYEKNRTGDLMARATNDLKAISETAGFGILTLVDSTLYMATIIIAMGMLVSWELTFLAMIPLPILAIVVQMLGKKIHTRYMEAQEAFGDMNDSVLESVGGVRVIRAYVQERASEQQFADMTDDVYEKNMAVERIDALFAPVTKVLTSISYMVGLGYGAFLVAEGTMTLGDLVAFNVYLGMIVWPMFAIGELINILQRGNASLDRVNETLDYPEDVTDPKNPVKTGLPEQIGFKDFSFTYPQSSSINLQGINLSMNSGQTLGVVGKTGSGKTTFVKQLMREYPTGQGSILMNGIELKKLTKDQLRSWIGYVPQDHVLFSRTIRENILFGKSDASERELIEALRLSYFEKDLALLPSGLDTLVGEKGVALSGGQKQRISIARALIKNPEILILDDSLSAVDAKTEARIIENIQAERSGKTTIITTHRLSAVKHADWIVVLDDGKIIEEGTHDDLLKTKGWYNEQFLRQQIEEV